jgi:hypothetical protein
MCAAYAYLRPVLMLPHFMNAYFLENNVSYYIKIDGDTQMQNDFRLGRNDIVLGFMGIKNEIKMFK